MKIRMTTSLAGVDFALAPGDERDFENSEAVRLISAGFAVPVDQPEIETATKKVAAEKRTKG